MRSNRILEYDILRSLAVIWIIAIWHLANYFSTDSVIGRITDNCICEHITYVMLSLFMFLSGLFTNTGGADTNNVKAYYIKKMKRFYPLYVMASLTLYLTTIPHHISFYSSISQLILSLFGVATFLNQAPSTLWFMDMLLFFIMITPMLTFFGGKVCKVTVMVVLYALIYVASVKMNIIDLRFVRYAPFYFVGLLLTPSNFLELSEKHGLKALLLATLIILVGKHHFFIDMIMYASLIIGETNLVSVICRGMNIFFLRNIIGIISYSSMCAYFFHRQLYALGVMSHLMVYIIPCFIFCISYYIQKVYDKILKYAKIHNSILKTYR